MGENVLAIGAHFDDVEIGCGGTLIKHVKNGDKVIMLILTHSAYTDSYGNVKRSEETAKSEGGKAAKIIGAEKVICLGMETKKLRFNEEMIHLIEKVILENNINKIYTHWMGDAHTDHYATARATIAAARRCPSVLMYKSNQYDGTSPLKEQYYVDITDVFNEKVEAVKCHESEMEKNGPDWVDFIKNRNFNSGLTCGVKYAEVFEVHKILWR